MNNLERAGRISGGLPGLLLEAKNLAQGFMRGEHGRRKIGSGEAFWQFRQWEEGDSSRDIDWRRSAKGNDVFISQREWEAAQSVYFYRDNSASMDFSSSKKLLIKRDYAEILLLSLSMVLLKAGEKVSLSGTDLPLQVGYNSADKIAEFLPIQNGAFNGENILLNSEVIIISDFYYSIEEIKDFCSLLKARNIKAVLVQIFDKVEKNLDYKGSINFYDIEGLNNERLFISSVDSIRDEYKKKFLKHNEQLVNIANKFGFGFKSICNSVSLENALAQIYNIMLVK